MTLETTLENDIVLEAIGVGFSYRAGDPILRSVSLTVNRGDFFGIIGTNGSGKTTLLKILTGIYTPTTGQVRLFGEYPRRSKKRAKLGYVSQRATAFDRNFPATALEVVLMGRVAQAGLFHRLDKRDRYKALAALREVGLEEVAGRKIGELSSGQQQRVIIARALVGEPELIIFDEPTVGVDVNAEAAFFTLLKKLNKEKKITIIVVTHDLDIVGHQVNKLMCLHCSISTHGTPKQFLEGQALHMATAGDVKLIPHHEDRGHHEHHDHERNR